MGGRGVTESLREDSPSRRIGFEYQPGLEECRKTLLFSDAARSSSKLPWKEAPATFDALFRRTPPCPADI